jgi:hypothetical protein
MGEMNINAFTRDLHSKGSIQMHHRFLVKAFTCNTFYSSQFIPVQNKWLYTGTIENKEKDSLSLLISVFMYKFIIIIQKW